MRLICSIFLLTALLVSVPSHALTDCGAAMGGEADPTLTPNSTVNEEELNKTIQLLWYPSPGYEIYTHTEIVVDDIVWNPYHGYEQRGPLSTFKRTAHTAYGKVFVSVHLKVSEEELANLKQFLKEREGISSKQNCIGGACAAISKNTKIIIPYPISKIPTLTAGYLTAMGKLGYERVLKVEYIGPRKFTHYFGTEPIFESLYSLGWLAGGAFVVEKAGALLISGLDHAAHYLQHLIPLVTHGLFGKTSPARPSVCLALNL